MNKLETNDSLRAREKQIRERFELARSQEEIAPLPERVRRAKRIGLSGVWKIATAQAVERYICEMVELANDVYGMQWQKNEIQPDLFIDCSQLIVVGDLILDSLTLSRIDFRCTLFRGDVSFEQIFFIGPALFSGCSFEKRLFVHDTTFANRSKFFNTHFHDLTIFRNIKFSYIDEVDFSESIFQDRVEFSNLENISVFNFSSARLEGIVEFSYSKFSLIDFSNANFLKPASFEGDEFYGAPIFHSAEIQEGTSFARCTFKPSKGVAVFTNRDYVGFRTLKLKMASLRAQREEASFYALELRAGRSSNLWPLSPIKYVISLIYDIGSEYGQSPGRAVSLFFIWNSFFCLVYWLIRYWSTIFNYPTISISSSGGSLLGGYPALALVLQSAFNPLVIFSDKAIVMPDSFLMLILSFLQSIGSLGFLTLLLLAIRGNFQKGSGN